ncbi:5877_t:CDS:2 [Gigaspora rosea]|nr:5877_t:CDS:2 [Gigaspora rosea]
MLQVRNISADDCIFQPPTRRGPKKVVKNEVIKVGKNDSDDPPESFTDNNEFDAFLQFDISANYGIRRSELFITRNRNHGTIVDGSNPRLHVPNPRQQHEPNPRQQHTPYPRQQHAPNPRQPNPRQHSFRPNHIQQSSRVPHILLLPTSTKQTRSTRPTKQMRSTQPTKQTRSTQPTKQTRSTQPTKQT